MKNSRDEDDVDGEKKTTYFCVYVVDGDGGGKGGRKKAKEDVELGFAVTSVEFLFNETRCRLFFLLVPARFGF